ncbi:MAG: hypothetical protein SGJ11_10105 [Phycisphaerae bacterium]|nr:hypothetical protein [Phycisphaerae bacterium]
MSTTKVDAMLDRVNAKRTAEGSTPLLPPPRDLPDLADPPLPGSQSPSTQNAP